MGLPLDQEVIYVMCNANTLQKWVLSNKDAGPAKKGEKGCLTLSFCFDRLLNQWAWEMFVEKLFGADMTHTFCIVADHGPWTTIMRLNLSVFSKTEEIVWELQ